MKYLAFLILILSVSFCTKKVADIDKKIPDCIELILDKNDTYFEPIKRIKAQKVNGEMHYWLNTAVAYDPEFILNAQCDTVCTASVKCGSPLPACWEKYDPEKWEVIWTK